MLPLDHHFKPILENVDPVLQVTFFLVVTCQVLLGVSRCGCSFLLQMVQYIIHLTLFCIGPNLSQGDKNSLVAFQLTPAQLRRHFALETRTPFSQFAQSLIVTLIMNRHSMKALLSHIILRHVIIENFEAAPNVAHLSPNHDMLMGVPSMFQLNLLSLSV